MDASELSSDTLHAVFLSQLLVQVQAVSWRVDGQCGERTAEFGTIGKLLGRQSSELWAIRTLYIVSDLIVNSRHQDSRP
jgi:hypothetical protein